MNQANISLVVAKEKRKPSLTSGSYLVYLPDGYLQTVTYHVDGSAGYVAQVEYKRQAQYPPPAAAVYGNLFVLFVFVF